MCREIMHLRTQMEQLWETTIVLQSAMLLRKATAITGSHLCISDNYKMPRVEASITDTGGEMQIQFVFPGGWAAALVRNRSGCLPAL